MSHTLNTKLREPGYLFQAASSKLQGLTTARIWDIIGIELVVTRD